MKKADILGERSNEFSELQKELHNVPLLAQGNVFATPPAPDAPRARTHYKWTRKLHGKTVSVTLSREQYEAFSAAIKANRRVEEALKKIREISQDAMLTSLPDSPGKRARKLS